MSKPFVYTDEQQEFRDMVRRFVEASSPETSVREQMETERGFDDKVWRAMAEQLGLQGLIVPEAHGGQGFGPVELGIVLEEMGRALLCAPYFSTVVLGVNALLASADEAAMGALLPGIAAGDTIATLAIVEPSGRWDESGIEMEALPEGEGWQLSGTKLYVTDGHVADLVLVIARTASGTSLFRVDGQAAGLTRTPVDALDMTRKLARLEFAGVPASLVGREGQGGEILARVLDLASVALASEQAGGAERCLEMAVAYAKDRIQFGRPIGSFQAIKHKCADMLLEVESAKSAAGYAAFCAAESPEELTTVAPLAKAYCSDAYLHVVNENIQIHGGIGFTWEHPAHLYFRRAKSTDLLFGDATEQRERLAAQIGL